ncbi:MerR family DNA-binding transcriptional regulator [Pseudonocardia sp. T1-2H]|uniref:MerR family DNA-binding transcriptional regulator n=1 Tax=Pseudonocardia sp. T1-2H TaxID=3128899 RepID=UPI0031012EB8
MQEHDRILAGLSETAPADVARRAAECLGQLPFTHGCCSSRLCFRPKRVILDDHHPGDRLTVGAGPLLGHGAPVESAGSAYRIPRNLLGRIPARVLTGFPLTDAARANGGGICSGGPQGGLDIVVEATRVDDRSRFYEQAGILPPPARTPGGYRDYDETALAKLQFVRSGQALGLSPAPPLLAVRPAHTPGALRGVSQSGAA